jgi:hypothetical protein
MTTVYEVIAVMVLNRFNANRLMLNASLKTSLSRLVSGFIAALLFCATILPAAPAQAQGGTRPNVCPTEDTPNCTFGLPTDEYNKLLPLMQANPVPTYHTVDVDTKQINQYSGFYRVSPNSDVFDAPNGNIIGKSGDGFNFVGVYKVQDGFAMMRNKTWLRLTSMKRTSASAFSGITTDKQNNFPVAWVIQASIPSKVPGGVRTLKTPAIARYTLVNLFAVIKVDGWNWYLVGPGQWLEQRKLASVKPAIQPEGAAKKWVAVDLYEQTLTAYEGDKMVFATLISSGLPGTQTNVGTFKVWQRAETTRMSGAMGQPEGWSLPSVPYVMFFDNDISLHGTYWHDGFGFRHSRGCVNMTITDAEWVFNWIGGDDLTVTVWDSRNTGDGA